MTSWLTNGNSTCLGEIARHALTLKYQGRVLRLPLQWRSDNTLEPDSRHAVGEKVRMFLGRSLLPTRTKIICAIPGRGVSLRRLSVPAAGEDELRNVLQLQIESEFPLPPEQLAWGYAHFRGSAPDTKQVEVLIAALRKDILREYARVFEHCNATVTFTPAALARALACPPGSLNFGHLEISPSDAELVIVEAGVPVHLRTFKPSPEHAPTVAPELTAALNGRTLYAGPQVPGQTDLRSWPMASALEILPPDADSETTLAIAGLERALRHGLPWLRLSADTVSSPPGHPSSARFPTRLAITAGLLALLTVVTPYLVAVVRKPSLEARLAALKSDKARLAMIDSELEFLRYLKQNQAPYLDAIYFIARSAPAGTRFDQMSLNRRGEVTFKGSFRDPNQIADFRAKLLDTGFFSGLAVEEQAPSPDRQKFTVRMTASWKSDQIREAAAALAAKEPERPKTTLMMGGMGPGMMPPESMMGGPGPMIMPGGPMAMPPGAAMPVSLPSGAPMASPTLPPGVSVTPVPAGAVPPESQTPPGIMPGAMPKR